MEATAKQKYIIGSPRKFRRVAKVIQGKPVTEAYHMLRLMPYDAATIVLKKLIEASSNAQVKYGVEADKLFINKVFADEATALKRIRPRAQGRVYRREKPMSHFTIHVKVVGS
ncbi:MAG: 50S ribosomal protein L22 [Cyanobacteria bacterium]|jgi:large subunit ribosomal protein L22|nr:50S ribosomal protein L22 [Cyanobacteriota bacterium]